MKFVPSSLPRKDMHDLIMSAVLPRPIAFVSTIDEAGIFNLAPFSCFAPVGMKPALVCLQISWRRDGEKKDTLRNIETTKEFVINAVDESFAKAMNQAATEYPRDIDEFKEVGLTPVFGDIVSAPMVSESPIHMECKLLTNLEFGEVPTGGHVVIGEVVMLHVQDRLLKQKEIDISQWNPIGRLGGDLYCRVKDIFEMKRTD